MKKIADVAYAPPHGERGLGDFYLPEECQGAPLALAIHGDRGQRPAPFSAEHRGSDRQFPQDRLIVRQRSLTAGNFADVLLVGNRLYVRNENSIRCYLLS